MLGVLMAFSQANHVAFAAQTQGLCSLPVILTCPVCEAMMFSKENKTGKGCGALS